MWSRAHRIRVKTHVGLRRAAAAVAVMGLYAASVAIVGSSEFARAPDLLSLGVALDLSVTAALIVHLLVLRPERRSPAFLVPVVAAGIATAHALLPSGARLGLWTVGFIWVAVEAALATLTLVRLRKVARVARHAARGGAGFVAALEAGFTATLGMPRVAAALARELGAFRFALFGWFSAGARTGAGRFAMHRDGRFAAIIGLLVYLLAVETVAVHLLIARASPLAAWIGSATSIYAVIWLLGDLHAVRLTPAVIGDGWLRVELGLRWRLAVPLTNIARADVIPPAAPRPAADLDVSPSGAPNVLLTLSAPVRATGPFGIKREARTVALYVEHQTEFLAALRT